MKYSAPPKRGQACGIAIALLALLLAGNARADAYDFEMIIFERPGVAGEYSAAAGAAPDRAIATATLDASTVGKKLGPIAYTLQRKGMNVLKHVAWRQTPGARGSKGWRAIDAGRLSGLVRLTRGRFLHLDVDLQLTDTDTAAPHRIKLNRRMRSDELHYVDHPKVGIIIRAERFRPAASGDAQGSGAESGEPKPAKPSGTS